MHISSVVIINFNLWFSFYELGLRWPHDYSFPAQVIKWCLLLSPLQCHTHLFHIVKRVVVTNTTVSLKKYISTKLNSMLNKTNCLSFTSESAVGATLLQVTNQRRTLREKCRYSELFWSVFSCIGTECGPKAGRYRPDNSE